MNQWRRPNTRNILRQAGLFAVAWMSLLFAPLSQAADPQPVQMPSPLVISISDNYSPFTVIAPGNRPAGLFVEIWQLWSKVTGHPVEFKISEWTETLSDVRDGETHLHAGLFESTERGKIYSFTKPIQEIPTSIYFLAGKDDKPQWLNDLIGKNVATMEGSYQLAWLNERYPDLKAVALKNNDLLVKGLLDGTYDAIVSEGPAIYAALAKSGLQGSVEHLDRPLFTNFVVGAVANKNRALIPMINEGLDAISVHDLIAAEQRWLNNPATRYFERHHLVPTLSDSDKAWLRDNSVIRMGVTTFIKPVDIISDDGEYSGFNADLMKLLSKQLGVQIVPEFHSQWGDVVANAMSGSVEAAFSLSRTPERERNLLFTKPYAYDPAIIVVAKDNTEITDWYQLEGKRVSVVKGASTLDEVRSFVGSGRVIVVEGDGEALKKLAAGDVDAHVSWLLPYGNAMRADPVAGLRIATTRNTESGSLRIGVHNSRPQLARILDIGLSMIPADQMTALRNRWLNPAPETAESFVLSREERAWLIRHPTINVGMMNGWPPLSFVNDLGTPSGVSSALLDALNERLGGRLHLTPQPFKQSYEAVLDGSMDALFDITPRPDRMALFNFTPPYLTIPHAIIAPKDAPYLQSESSLRGKTVALERGFGNVSRLRADYPETTVLEYNNTSAALDAVARGEADAYLGNRAVATYIMERELIHNLKAHGRASFEPVILALGTRKDNVVLHSILDKALADIDEQERSVIFKRWVFGGPKTASATITLTDKEQDWAAKNPTLRVHNEREWGPFNFFANGKPQGLSIDYITLVAKKLGLEVDFVTGPSWSEFLTMLKSGQLDVMLNIVKTPERDQFIRFSEPYADNPPVIIARQGNDFKNLASLQGRTVCIPAGFFYEELLKAHHEEIIIKNAVDQSSCLNMVSSGRVDATMGGLAVQTYLINKQFLSNLIIAAAVDDTRFVNQLRIGVSRDNPVLQTLLIKGMAAVNEAEQRALNERWIASSMANAFQSRTAQSDGETLDDLLVQLFAIVGGFLLITLLLLAVYKRVVSQASAKLYDSNVLAISGVAFVIMFLGGVMTATWFVLADFENSSRQRVGESLTTILGETHHALRVWIDTERKLTDTLLSDQRLTNAAARLLQEPEQVASLRSSLEHKQIKAFFDEHFGDRHAVSYGVLSLTGGVFSSSHPEQIGGHSAIAELFSERLAQAIAGKTVFIPPTGDKGLGNEGGLSEVYFAAPVKGAYGQTLGVIVIGYPVSEAYAMIISRGRLMETGESYTFNRYGRMLSDSRFIDDLKNIGLLKDRQSGIMRLKVADPGVNLHTEPERATPLGERPLTLMSSEATAGRNGTFVEDKGYRDYRGVPVFGAWVWDDDLAIGITTEVDAEEALGEFQRIRLIILSLVGGAVFIGLSLTVLSVMMGRRATKELESLVAARTEELFASRERANLLLASIGEGVFGTDAEGHMTFINPAACSMLGYDDTELLGKKIHAIIHHTKANGHDYPVTDCPMYHAYTDGDPSRVDDEVLWRKDGSSFPVEYIATPMHNDDELVGSVISFSDITQRRQAQSALEDAYGVISDSIDYAARIQQAVLPSQTVLDTVLTDHFVIWQPRDVVGGDVYWSGIWGDGVLIALVDCTGHGVPGAFMTLITVGALDRAMTEVPVGDVAGLMTRVHQIVQRTLSQHTKNGGSDDGLEMGLCYINSELDTVHFSGARFSLFIADDDQVGEIKGLKKGLGYRGIPVDQTYEAHEVLVTPGRSFYMTTDGVIDQVGGSPRRTFGKRRFKDVLQSMREQPFNEQRDKLLNVLEDYQGEETRRDDVAVIGFTI